MLPLGVLLIGSLLAPPVTGAATQQAASGIVRALSATVLAVVVAALVSGLARWVPSAASRVLLSICGAVAAGGVTTIVAAQFDGPGAATLPVALLVAAGWAWAVFVLHGRERVDPEILMEQIPELDRVPWPGSELPNSRSGANHLVPPTVWQEDVQSTRMRGLALFGAVVLAAATALSVGVTPLWGSVAVLIAGLGFSAAVWLWSSVTVRIDHQGLSMVSGVVKVRLLQVAPEEILGVSSAEIDPMAWGGWGLRWTLRHTAFIAKGGPGIVVHRSSGRPLAIEIPAGTERAKGGAALLRQLGLPARDLNT